MKFGFFKFWKSFLFRTLLVNTFMSLLIICQSSGQTIRQWESKYLSEFEGQKDIESLMLSGYFNTSFYTEIRLLHDNELWIGEMVFPNENLTYRLEGGKVDSFIVLIESDYDGRETGILKIDKELEKYKCIWYNNLGNMDHHFEMLDQQWNPLMEKAYTQVLTSYEGYLGQKKYQLNFLESRLDITKLNLFDEAEKRFEDIHFNCINASCNKFELGIGDREIKKYFGVRQSDGVSLYTEDDERELEGSFILNGKRNTNLLKKINDRWMLAVEYPILPDGLKNTGIYSNAQEIFNGLQIQLDELSKEEDLSSRWRFYANAWMEIEHWDDELISGKWTIQKSWNNDIECLSFNFLLKDKKEMIIKEEFRDDFDFEFYLAQFIEDQRNHMPEFKDPLMRSRLQNANFNHLIISAEGIKVSSDYNTIFGSFEMIIPASEIMQYLRKKSKLKGILD